MTKLTAACAALTFATLTVQAATPARAESRTIDKHFHERFEVASGARLDLDHGDGDVFITPWDQDAIEIDVRYLAKVTRIGVGRDSDFTVEFDQRGDTVRVVGHEPGGVNLGFFNIRESTYEYRIQAPSWVVLALEGDDGDVEVSGWRNEISIELDDGDIRLDDTQATTDIRAEDGDIELDTFAGRLKIVADDGDVIIRNAESERMDIRTEDGDIELDQVAGRLEIKADDGSVELTRMRPSGIVVTTADGSIDLEIDGMDGDLDVVAKTDDGDVGVVLAKGIGVTFDIRMDDGDVDVRLPNADITRDKHAVSGSSGNGAGRIQVTTGDGDVTVTSGR